MGLLSKVKTKAENKAAEKIADKLVNKMFGSSKKNDSGAAAQNISSESSIMTSEQMNEYAKIQQESAAQSAMVNSQMMGVAYNSKKCPKCKAVCLNEPVKCPYCGADLTGERPLTPEELSEIFENRK